MKFIKKLFVLSIFALSLVLTGCLNFDDVKTLEFVQAPQSIYYLVGVNQAIEAQKEVLNDVTVKINGNVYTLFDAISQSLIQYEGLDLTTEGTKTLIVTLRDDPNVRLTYVYKVVDGLAYELFAGGKGTESDPYKIETPQQFMNIATKVYGTPTPSPSTKTDVEEKNEEDEQNWKTYYNAVMPYFTNGVYFKITKDLDFAGITYYPLGVLGGQNFVPFTGTIDGDGHKISNLTLLTKGEISAMFGGINNACIKNITFENIQSNDTGAKYTAILFARPPKIETDYTNVLYNLNVVSATLMGTRAAAFATEASNTLFIKCSGTENVKIYAVSENSGALTGFVTDRTYSYISASSISAAEDPVGLLSISTVNIKIASFLSPEEANIARNLIPQPEENYKVYSPANATGTEGTSNFKTAFFGCEFYGSLLTPQEAETNKTIMTKLTSGAGNVAVFGCTFSEDVSKGVESTTYDIFYNISCVDDLPHNVYSIPATSENYIKLKYNADGKPTSYAEDSDVIDNKIYLSHDIYGNPVIGSEHYFTMKGVSITKVFRDSSSNIIGFKKISLDNVTPISAGTIN